MNDLREQIRAAITSGCGVLEHLGTCAECDRRTDAVWALVQPTLDTKDTQLRQALASVEHLKGDFRRMRERAEKADAERDRLKGIIRNRDREIAELRTLLPPDEHGYQIPGDDD